ncbi:MAG: hypothetical protein ACK2T5_11060 [Anaerolineales bacterium]
MSTSWMISTQNDPLGTVREVLHTLWITAKLECILAPQNGAGRRSAPLVRVSERRVRAVRRPGRRRRPP